MASRRDRPRISPKTHSLPRAHFSRRRFLQSTAATGLWLSWERSSFAKTSSWQQQLRRYRIWDLHAHLTGQGLSAQERVAWVLRYGRRLGVERVVFFMGMRFRYDPTPAQFRKDNDDLMRAVEASRGAALGFVYLNPKFPEESIRELHRCVRDGPLVGVKLWVALRAQDPRVLQVVREAARLGVPVFQHTWYKTTGNLPGESTPEDLAQLAQACPQAQLIAGHTGGQWAWGIAAIRRHRNIWAGLGGTDPQAGMVEMAVRELGARRVLFGSDTPGRTFASQVAKVLGASVSEQEKFMILGANLRRLLAPVLQTKGEKVQP